MYFPLTTSSAVVSAVASVVLGVTAAIGMVANLLVVIAVLGDAKMRRSPTNLLLTNLVSVANDDSLSVYIVTACRFQAVADFLFLLSSLTLGIPLVIYGMFGVVLRDIFFAFHWYAAKVAMSISVFSYVAVSVERYHAILTS